MYKDRVSRNHLYPHRSGKEVQLRAMKLSQLSTEQRFRKLLTQSSFIFYIKGFAKHSARGTFYLRVRHVLTVLAANRDRQKKRGYQ